MGWPQITMIAFICAELGFQIARDGQPKTGNYSFGLQFFSWLLIIAILWWGDFWE